MNYFFEREFWLLQLLCLFDLKLIKSYTNSSTGCIIPDIFLGEYYSLENGLECHTLIDPYYYVSTFQPESTCSEYRMIEGSKDGQGLFDIRLVIHNKINDCYKCIEIHIRTRNVLQLKQSTCVNKLKLSGSIPEVCNLIAPYSDLTTLFRKDPQVINCISTIEGTYQFTYEIDQGGGSICDSPHNIIKACQQPGSVYTDNQIFIMNFNTCPDVSTSSDSKVRYQCLGTWTDSNNNVFSAMADIGTSELRFKFRCMLTRFDQEMSNYQRYTLSRWASCAELKSPYEGPIRLILTPAIGAEQIIRPSCFLPKNFTGEWYKPGEYDTAVTINLTHIYFLTGYSQYTYRETYFTCQQMKDSRYLMTVSNIGRCEVDYVCMDFLPRHHSLIRWRMSTSSPVSMFNDGDPDYLEKAFRHVCTWSSFTFNRDDTSWKYMYFIMQPPPPVQCPIGGRYLFQQIGDPDEFIRTRVKGITDRPRHKIDCLNYVSEMQSCSDNPQFLLFDSEYCETLDHTGKPIGEYDIPDRQISCAGYWMEDMRSYLVTFDEDDVMSSLRCWVYERTDWRKIAMSRSSSPLCSSTQTAFSTSVDDFVSLQLMLTERERLWDSCPQRYDTGANPWKIMEEINILSPSSTMSLKTLSIFSKILLFCVLLYIYHKKNN